MSSTKKLAINSQYLLYTNYGTISNLKVKVIAILNYEDAQKIAYSIKNLAINEKVIDLEKDDTELYLKDQLFYKCIFIDGANNETPYLVWDDVIDGSKTTKLSVDYTYNMKLRVSSDLISNLPTIENSIITFIEKTYASTVVPTLISTGEVSETIDEVAKELAKYKELFESAKAVADKMATLKQIESLIEYFAKDDMYEKISDLSEMLNNIKSTVSTISEMIS